MKLFIFGVLGLLNLFLYGQDNNLSYPTNCDCFIDTILDGVIFATGNSECIFFNIDNRENVTWLVFDKSNGKLLYQATIIEGVKEGIEVFFNKDNEKIITNYSQGHRNGYYYMFYSTGELKYKLLFKNGKPNRRMEYFNKSGELLDFIKVDKHGNFQPPAREGL